MGTLTSRSVEETYEIGKELGRLLRSGDFVGLNGSLGAGKTALVRGIAAGAGVDEHDVSSPTFAIVQTYQGRLPVHHADWYRLSNLDDLVATGFFDLLDEGGAAVVEWVSKISVDIPMLRIQLELVDATTRRLHLESFGADSERLATALLSK